MESRHFIVLSPSLGSKSGACQPNLKVTPPVLVPTPDPFGIKGPMATCTLYSRFQVDAQGSVYLGKGLSAIVSGLNLNNEVFGFYQGSPRYPIQREYHKPTYSLGLRWVFGER